jgi:hypothetical protein
MSQVKIRVEIKDKNKTKEALSHFQRIATYLRKQFRKHLYFIKKSRRKSINKS